MTDANAPRTRWLLPAAVALLSIIPYWNGLSNGLAYDDVALVAENPRIRSIGAVGRIFATDWWDGKRPQSLLYRPLTMATFSIDHAVGRGAALPFHVQNLAWHAAAGVALYALVLWLFSSAWLAAAAAALFAVHPVHTEAVNGIVGRAELMSACLGLAALRLAFRRPLYAGVFLLLALLSKETAIVIPAVAVAWWLMRPPADRGRVGKPLAAMAVAVAAYLAMRTAVLGSPVAPFPAAPGTVVVDNPIAGATGVARLLTPVRVFGHAAALLAYPRTLSADYSYDQIPLVRSLDAGTVLSSVVLAGLAVAAFALRARAPASSFGIVLLLAAWALTSNLPVVIGTIFGERLLYLPSAGACLAAAGALDAAASRFRARRMATVVVAVLVLAGAGRTWARNPDWKDSVTLFAATAESSPRSCKALNGYASALLAAGRPLEAKAWAERSLAIHPSYAEADETLAKALRELANRESDRQRQAELRAEAAEHVRRQIAAGSGLADAWNVAGGLALDAGDVAGALDAYAKSLALDPSFSPALTGSGVALARQADRETEPKHRSELREEAVRRFERALASDPGNAEARRNLTIMQAGDPASDANRHGLRGSQLLADQRLPEALAEFREAARLDPQAARAYLGIGTVLAAQADREPDAARRDALVDEALASFRQALSVEPDNADAHMNLGILYLKRRQPEKVAEHFRAYLRLVPGTPRRDQMEETIRQMEAYRR